MKARHAAIIAASLAFLAVAVTSQIMGWAWMRYHVRSN